MTTPQAADAASPDFAHYISHQEFRTGLPAGRFRVIVNRKLARGYMSQRLWLLPVLLPVFGAGFALALSGHTWAGGLLVALGVVVNRAVVWNAGKILLHLAAKDPAVYDFATQHAILEVRRA
jgi:hypothetical protein